MKHIPKQLQPFLWSVKIEDLDLEEDKVYIINQILAYGGLEEWKWLLKAYSVKSIKDVFVNHPIKTYRAPSFNLVKNFFLDLKNTPLVEERYVVNTPRIIR